MALASAYRQMDAKLGRDKPCEADEDLYPCAVLVSNSSTQPGNLHRQPTVREVLGMEQTRRLHL